MKGLVLHFDLGYCYENDASVREQIFDRLPATISLALGARVIWLAVGIPVGVISATRAAHRGSTGSRWAARWSRSRRRSTGSGWSRSTSSPTTSASSRSSPGAGSYVPLSDDPAAWFESLILPWFVLAASFAAIYARLLRVEPDRGDVARTTSARRARRACASGASCCATACARRSRRS